MLLKNRKLIGFILAILLLLPTKVLAQAVGGQVTRPLKNQQVTKTVQTKKRQTKVKQNEQDASESAGYDIIISCNVPTATMFIDGSSNGFASGSRFLKTGSHSIRLTADGYEPLSQTIYVNSNSRSFSFNMKKKVVDTPKEPSATIGDFAIGVLSHGDVLCRIDDVNIDGAKDKEVEVTVFFNNKEVGVIDFLTKKIKPSYESSHYESIIVKGNVSDLTTLRKNKGNFEVYVWILINPIKKDGKETYDGWGESKIRRKMTIYHQGHWKSRGGGMADQ